MPVKPLLGSFSPASPGSLSANPLVTKNFFLTSSRFCCNLDLVPRWRQLRTNLFLLPPIADLSPWFGTEQRWWAEGSIRPCSGWCRC